MLIISVLDLCIINVFAYASVYYLRDLAYENPVIRAKTALIIVTIGICNYNMGALLGEYRVYPFSCSLLSWAVTMQHLVGQFMLMHSNYQNKYYFYNSMSHFMYYSYMKSYPYANYTLNNAVFVTF